MAHAAPVAVLVILASLLSAATARKDTLTSPTTTGHLKMVETLRKIAAQAADDNPLIGKKQLVDLRAQLASLPQDSSISARLILMMQVAQLEIRQNNVEEAIRLLQDVHDRMKRIPNVPQETSVEATYRLAIAFMRLGETRNCSMMHMAESCIIPIQKEAIHSSPEGATNAVKYFTEILREIPEDSPGALKAKWLLNIAYMTLGKYPGEVPSEFLIPPSVFQSKEKFPAFPNIAPKLGLDGFNLAGGAIADDFDNDGYLDLLVSTWDPNEHMHYFHNDQNGKFSDRTGQANLGGLLGGFNMVQADYNNDGFVDVYVMRGGWLGAKGRFPHSLLRNNGDGTFTDVTYDAGLGADSYPSQTASWADYDNDGDLDLFVGNESAYGLTAPCQLFRNNGNGTFTEVGAQAGVQNDRFAKSVIWGDYDNDGDPDLYVSNVGQPNRLYRNNGDGTFTDVAPELGVDRPIWSFPSWFWDFDNDGVLDLFVSSYDWTGGNLISVVASMLGQQVPQETAALYRGDGTGHFKNVAEAENLTQFTLPMGANFGDLDNDGYLDFYLGTGYPDYEALMPNIMYHNQGGKSFSDVTYAGGFGHLQKGHAVVFADFDNDGDQDVFEQMGGFYPGDKYYNVLYENPGFGNHWITIKLEGKYSNRSAIGARIRVDLIENGKPRTVYRYVNSGGTFGGNPLRQTIGLGKAERISQIEIFWPTTKKSNLYKNVGMDQFIQIVEGEDHYTTLQLKKLHLGGNPPE